MGEIAWLMSTSGWHLFGGMKLVLRLKHGLLQKHSHHFTTSNREKGGMTTTMSKLLQQAVLLAQPENKNNKRETKRNLMPHFA